MIEGDDAIESEPDDGDKDYHEFGQSVGALEKIVDKYTEPGATVLDPCCGGGSTGVACVRWGRKFIGSDIDGNAVEMTRKRLMGEIGTAGSSKKGKVPERAKPSRRRRSNEGVAE